MVLKLYKFRSLNNFKRVLDIILNERLHCAHFKDLNDPVEGVFLAVHHLPPVLLQSKGTVRQARACVSELRDVDAYSQVCSLSASFKDLRLWSYYADGHKGIAIEIDFTGHEADVLPVDYLTELPKYYSYTVLGTPFPDNVLRQKTIHWQYENEWRILQSAPYYSIEGRVASVLLGARISPDDKSLLDRVVPDHIPIIETKINETTLEVEPKAALQRVKRYPVSPPVSRR